jgi:hypothetical protein
LPLLPLAAASTEEAKVSVTSTRRSFASECRVDLMLGFGRVRWGVRQIMVVCRGFVVTLEKSAGTRKYF